jgi:DNA repair protein RecO (recombination protein O)
LEGIVLRIVNYGETDRIVGLLTPTHGKISAFAPSARTSRKRFAGALDFFNRLRVDVSPPKDPHGSLWRLSRAEVLDTHLELRGDLRRRAQASYLTECLWSLLGDGDPHPGVYEWFGRALGRLSSEPVSVAEDLRVELEMLSLCGFAPHWDQCLECGDRPKEGRVFFSFHRGGIICDRCGKSGEGRWIDARSVVGVAAGEVLPPAATAPLRRVLNSFVSHTLGREPKSQKFREEVFHA